MQSYNMSQDSSSFTKAKEDLARKTKDFFPSVCEIDDIIQFNSELIFLIFYSDV